jgi:hypothetical protein
VGEEQEIGMRGHFGAGLLAGIFVFGAALAGEPVRVHSANPHYFEWNGKPVLLITSAEHYGAVVNGEFDYVRYLDALARYGLNYTRIYPGFLFEPVGKFIPGNSLGVRPRHLALPWARSTEPGYVLGGGKFDLDRWDPAFFARLKDFLAKARERGVVVEICFFNAQYTDTWPISPLYYENNIQGEGRGDYVAAQTLRDPRLARREADYVRKIVEEVNGFDNVILEICDEPYLTGTPIEEAGKWIAYMIDAVVETERRLPRRHLVAQQIEGPRGGPCDFTSHPGVPVITTQYLWEASHQQMGGLQALEVEYGKNKPIELNETDYYPVWYRGDKEAASRVEAWEFMVGGGAGYNHLNGVFTVENPAGDTPGNARVLSALRNLKRFLESFDFARMAPEKSLTLAGADETVHARGISEPGRQYAVYLHHSKGGKGSAYVAAPGSYTTELSLEMPAGDYRVEWVDPASGASLGKSGFHHAGGRRQFQTPGHAVDVALRVVAAR